MKKHLICGIILGLFIMQSLIGSSVIADDGSSAGWVEQIEITASDGAENDTFGASISIDGDYIIVGAIGDDYDVTTNDAGSAYIFKRDGTTWNKESKLVSSYPAAGDFFGASVSISGDYAIIGAWGDHDNGLYSGAIYIFKRTDTLWSQQVKFYSSDIGAGDMFGVSVAISGDYAIAGAITNNDVGAAYIFKRTGANWAQQAKLTASSGHALAGFGSGVSIDGEYAVVGAFNNSGSGSAYVFKRDGTTWIQEEKLDPSDADTVVTNNFGYSTSISGDYILVGADDCYGKADFSGAAYVYKRNGTNWDEEAKLIASDSQADDNFGYSVSIGGVYAIIGADGNDDGGNEAGSAYIFKRDGTTWTQETKLLAGGPNDYFGTAVAMSGSYAVVGEVLDDEIATSAGSAHVYALDSDGDGVLDENDEFPNDATESQDTDGDGVGDNSDAFPENDAETTDTDEDGVGDNEDTDDDNDGFTDVEEEESGTDPKDAASKPGAPEPPHNVLATAGEGKIDLSWDQVTGDSVFTITKYNIYRGEFSINLALIANTTTKSYSDTDVVDGKTYYYQVTAISDAGESGKSDTVNASVEASASDQDGTGIPGFELILVVCAIAMVVV